MVARPISAVVRRRIRHGYEGEFETLMQSFVAFVLKQPGHLGIDLIRPRAGSRDYTVIDRFATEADRRRFTASEQYQGWMERLGEVSEALPRIDELEGLAFWFARGEPAPPKLKIAALTLLGVYPLSLLIPLGIAVVFPSMFTWPLWIQALVIGGLMVATLTWVVMPALTHLFHRWLFPSKQGGESW